MKSSFFCFQRLDFQSRILFGLGCLILYSLCKLLKDYQNKPSRSHLANILLSLSNLNAAKTSKTTISTIPPIPPPIRLQICSQSHSILLKYITTIRLNTYTTKHTFELRADRATRPIVLSVRCEPRQQVYSVATTLAATRVVAATRTMILTIATTLYIWWNTLSIRPYIEISPAVKTKWFGLTVAGSILGCARAGVGETARSMDALVGL